MGPCDVLRAGMVATESGPALNLKEIGYDLSTHHSKGLADFNGKEFDAAVTMGCGDECPLVIAEQRVDWKIPDPKEMPPDRFNEVRADVREQSEGSHGRRCGRESRSRC